MIKITFGTKRDDEFVFHYSNEENVAFGRGGNDVIAESPDFQAISDDRYFGGAGDDVITSQSGSDVIHGGNGNDVVNIFGHEPVTAYGGPGHDVAYVHVGSGGGVHPDALEIGHHLHGFEDVVFLA